MTMNVLNAVAQFERDLLIERTQSGLKRAKSGGKALGRPSTLSENQKQDVRDDLATGECFDYRQEVRDQPADHHASARGKFTLCSVLAQDF